MPEQSDINLNGVLKQSANHKDLSSKHSPIAPLAPLEYLQNQRRGSITDPSLHAASTSSAMKLNINYRMQFDQPSSAVSGPSNQHDSNFKNHSLDFRPSSPYVFGDATVQSDPSQQLRKLLRSPSLDHGNQSPSSALSQGSHDTLRNISGLNNSKELHHMNINQDRHDPQNSSRHQPFDYNMRRHSIAPGQNPRTLTHLPALPHGTKRKMSVDRNIFPPVGEEIDPQLVGPGVPSSSMEIDAEAPAPKRRGSAIDTHKIAQLSLNDRRNSVDSRSPQQQWWSERRDSTSSGLSTVSSVAGFSPIVTPGDSPHGRIPPNMAFAWSSSTQQSDSSKSSSTANESGMMLPSPFAPDRRMSMPDTFSTSGQTRVLRSQSRPPSSQAHNADNNTQSGPSSGQEDGGKFSKEPGQTPYSRSPELRVSHKLAERKRRKEMKDLFDELRDQLPADRGMKASKWEILSKAIDFVAQLKQSHQDMLREIDMLRHEVETLRQGGNTTFPPVIYGQAPNAVSGQYPPSGIIQPQHPSIPPQNINALSRPGSSQNIFSPNMNNSQSSQNGNASRGETHALT